MGTAIILCIIGVLNLAFYILSAVFLHGKGAGLIAGYNTMTDAEQQRYDREKLCKGAGVMTLAISIAMTLAILGAVLTDVCHILPHWVLCVSFVLFMSVTLGGVICYQIYVARCCKRH
ncbi:MAG: DUF3784 domain-containing protein [Ruminococcus sp.]